MSDDDLARGLLRGGYTIDNPTRALVETAKENSDLHEEVDRLWRELDIYRDALTVIAYLSPRMVNGGVDVAFDKMQVLAKAALSQLTMGTEMQSLLRRIRDENLRKSGAMRDVTPN